jgi:hypothetical protein
VLTSHSAVEKRLFGPPFFARAKKGGSRPEGERKLFDPTPAFAWLLKPAGAKAKVIAKKFNGLGASMKAEA